MSKKMLIDAVHPEETRVAIIEENNTLTDYDFKSTFKNTIKGNIYLAKVARVEPSLQAAFIDYGGNRHGFLAFSEIHPDYFRIPIADRERLDAELKGLLHPESQDSDSSSSYDQQSSLLESDDTIAHEEVNYKMPISTVGGDLPLIEDEDNDNVFRRLSLHRRYKIQEVINRHQILLVQVVKEERGGKGAALTTYLSLPGRYCVLMPNSPRSGGISRKISNPLDRKRLRKVLDSLEIPEGMGLIIRTAGKERTKIELRRDAEYLMRLWNTIRENTLKSIAPMAIYEEDDIIKRAIRDLYSKDIENILVEGEEGYKIARNFMKTLMPSHVKRISYYKNDTSPLFYHMGVERQIDQMHEAQVYLPSGGSIVIHPTEALVSIDINSGRATRERHIEETATKTNLEAAVEIARQVRLRDLAGLIVIDFIDMDELRNIAAVERRVKEVFRNDRARVQVGKISPFGLLELSRQRLCPSILETSAYPCPHCDATGYIRSTESKALQILRALEEQGINHLGYELLLSLSGTLASYIFNKKRDHLKAIEHRHQLKIQFVIDDNLERPGFKITAIKRTLILDAKTNDTTVISSALSVENESDHTTQNEVQQHSHHTNHHSTSSTTQENSQDGNSTVVEPIQRSSNHRRRQKRRRQQQLRNMDNAVTEENKTSLVEDSNSEVTVQHENIETKSLTTNGTDDQSQNLQKENRPLNTETHDDNEKRRRRRRHNRRNTRQGPKQESLATMETISHERSEPSSKLGSQNQNMNDDQGQNSAGLSMKEGKNNESSSAINQRQNKGWLRRLLE